MVLGKMDRTKATKEPTNKAEWEAVASPELRGIGGGGGSMRRKPSEKIGKK